MPQQEIEILLVEDNSSDVELALRALKKHNLGNRVTVVRDGVEALDFVFAEGQFSQRNIAFYPKVVFLDLKLPKVDGLEVLRRIRSDERTKYLPVVIMTASQEDKDLEESYKLGANGFVVKPMDFEQFVKVMAAMGYFWLVLNQTPVLPDPASIVT